MDTKSVTREIDLVKVLRFSQRLDVLLDVLRRVKLQPAPSERETRHEDGVAV